MVDQHRTHTEPLLQEAEAVPFNARYNGKMITFLPLLLGLGFAMLLSPMFVSRTGMQHQTQKPAITMSKIKAKSKKKGMMGGMQEDKDSPFLKKKKKKKMSGPPGEDEDEDPRPKKKAKQMATKGKRRAEEEDEESEEDEDDELDEDDEMDEFDEMDELQQGGLPGGYPGGLPGGYPGGFPGGFPGGVPGGFPAGYPAGLVDENDTWVNFTNTTLGKKITAIEAKYLEVRKEYDREVLTFWKKYKEKLLNVLQERSELLKRPNESEDQKANESGTPAIPGFWLQALKRTPSVQPFIEEWDEPVLEFLSDVRNVPLPAESSPPEGLPASAQGFKLEFHFAKNPFFTNEILWQEYHTEMQDEYSGSFQLKETKAGSPNWITGKDVTIEDTGTEAEQEAKSNKKKKVEKKKKSKGDSRPSFFRCFFTPMSVKMDIVPQEMIEYVMPQHPQMQLQAQEDEAGSLDRFMETMFRVGNEIRDFVVPYPARVLSGEMFQKMEPYFDMGAGQNVFGIDAAGLMENLQKMQQGQASGGVNFQMPDDVQGGDDDGDTKKNAKRPKFEEVDEDGGGKGSRFEEVDEQIGYKP